MQAYAIVGPYEIVECAEGQLYLRNEVDITLDGADATERMLRARVAELEKVAQAAIATLTEQRREFLRGDIVDLDTLEDALVAAGLISLMVTGVGK